MTETRVPGVHLVGFDNGVGLTRNLRILTGTLRARGYRVDFTNTRRRGGVPGLLQRLRDQQHATALARRRRRGLPPPYDFVLMEEHITPAFLDDAPHPVLLPHPEWFLPRDLEALRRIDLVLAKTREAARIFTAQGCHAVCIGFTSADRLDRSVPRERAFFHLAGSSRTKNTEPLLALWRRHPEWPRLTVVQHPREAVSGARAANIDHRIGYMDDAELKRLQNVHRFHLCPSTTEGFGHYIVEAMSAGAVVITLDAPPMNELVTPERGLLVASARTGAQHLAITYRFDDAAMEAAVERALAFDDARCDALGAAARTWYETERAAFPGRLDAALRALADGTRAWSG